MSDKSNGDDVNWMPDTGRLSCLRWVRGAVQPESWCDGSTLPNVLRSLHTQEGFLHPSQISTFFASAKAVMDSNPSVPWVVSSIYFRASVRKFISREVYLLVGLRPLPLHAGIVCVGIRRHASYMATASQCVSEATCSAS